MTLAVFPGTFDPITVGHIDIATRASTLFDHVLIAVAHNSTKRPLLDLETRVWLAQKAVEHLDGVEVTTAEGLLAQFCRMRGATTIVKGLRGGADYDVERPMALMNRSLTGIETVFITGDGALSHVASSLVRDVARHGGSIGTYVPEHVEKAVRDALALE